MKTNHVEHACDKFSAQFKKSMELLKHIAECQESDKGGKFHCDECSFSCKNKKNLKKHINKSHLKENPSKHPQQLKSQKNVIFAETSLKVMKI